MSCRRSPETLGEREADVLKMNRNHLTPRPTMAMLKSNRICLMMAGALLLDCLSCARTPDICSGISVGASRDPVAVASTMVVGVGEDYPFESWSIDVVRRDMDV